VLNNYSACVLRLLSAYIACNVWSTLKVSNVMCGHVVIILNKLVLFFSYAALAPEVFAIVWLHARTSVTILCYTPAYSLYSRASNTSTPSI
jgi:hypothetical protein